MVVISPTGESVPSQAYTSTGTLANFSSSILQLWFVILIGFVVAVCVIIAFHFWAKRKKEEDDEFLKEHHKTITQCKLFSERYKKELIPSFIINSIFMLGVLLSIASGLYMILLMPLVLFMFISISKGLSLINRRGYEIYTSDGIEAKYVGKYYGEFKDSTGHLNLAFYKYKKLYMFPQVELIKIPLSKNYLIEKRTKEKDKKKTKLTQIEFKGKPILQGNGIILIKCLGLEKMSRSHYFYPVMTDVNGNILDTKVFNFLVERSIIETGLLYEQTKEFGVQMKNAIKMNPSINYSKERGIESTESPQSVITSGDSYR